MQAYAWVRGSANRLRLKRLVVLLCGITDLVPDGFRADPNVVDDPTGKILKRELRAPLGWSRPAGQLRRTVVRLNDERWC